MSTDGHLPHARSISAIRCSWILNLEKEHTQTNTSTWLPGEVKRQVLGVRAKKRLDQFVPDVARMRRRKTMRAHGV